jgi:hypothetical protein
MKKKLKMLTAALGAVALAISVLSSVAPASAQVRGQGYSVPQGGNDDSRDRHDNRGGGGFGGGNGEAQQPLTGKAPGRGPGAFFWGY